jgi:hypothetical protein
MVIFKKTGDSFVTKAITSSLSLIFLQMDLLALGVPTGWANKTAFLVP